MFLVGGFVVRIAGREHESFDAQVHHLVKEFTHALRVCACEQGGVGGYAEATFESFANGFNRLVVGAFPTDGEIRSEERRVGKECRNRWWTGDDRQERR